MGKKYYEEQLQVHIQNMAVGETFVTKSRVVTRTELELYASINGDTLPVFLSEEASRKAGWDGHLVPGLLTFSLAVGLLIQSGFISQVVAFLGCDQVKFLKPVYAYDEIHVAAEVLSKKTTEKGKSVCTYKWHVINQRDELVAEGVNR
ncbi:MAG: MaoC family dehydratase N-terminal domain-containing protein [Desulfobacterales bacterium]|nr:MAG: MaoC family dehydratase N-terminal domain-containing protein [Desulfobacterales bacterium]